MPDTITLEARSGDVVVGVDGSPASLNAVRYALEEVRRGGGVLRLVHVVPDYGVMTALYPLPPEDLAEAGREVLRGVVEDLGAPVTDVTMETVLRRGSRVATLSSAARAARALVVGTDRRPVAARVLTGNTSNGVAASCVAPVVSVPETWRPGTGAGAVVVGVKSPVHATELLGEAFALAQSRGSRLVVLHSWRMPSGYDDIITDRVAPQEWADRARVELSGLLEEWASSYPEVDLEIRPVHDQAAHALIEASREADEIVLVRRAHGIPAAAHLGSTARAVLRDAHCPVRVVPPGHVVALPGLVLEEAGQLKKE
ncbi:universal stress protein [Nocardioides pantholopis]|uniref:universal stress protein n=1 Tax=Nocardioides pantholopis TaxID=2483798 RepID=UPI0013DE1E12|nr:universal stress protein [Nocardioides pantholopis]